MTKQVWDDMDAARQSAKALHEWEVYYILNSILEGLEVE
jgi:hypothetical protein